MPNCDKEQRCDRSKGDAFSSLALDSTSIFLEVRSCCSALNFHETCQQVQCFFKTHNVFVRSLVIQRIEYGLHVYSVFHDLDNEHMECATGLLRNKGVNNCHVYGHYFSMNIIASVKY